MKFLAWFFGIIFLLLTPLVANYFNFHLVFFSPQATKKVFVQSGFYTQAKSIIKQAAYQNDISGAGNKTTEATVEVLASYNLQPAVETVVDNFYAGLASNDQNFVIAIDLIEIKSLLNQTVNGGLQTSDDQSIPDQWRVDVGHYRAQLAMIKFFYQHYSYIMVGYILLFLLFLLFCILSGSRYLKVFFTILLIAGIFVLAQEIIWLVIDPAKIFAAIYSQGQSGLQTVVVTIYAYFKERVTVLLLYESLPMIAVGIVGLIVVKATAGSKIGDVPLHSK